MIIDCHAHLDARVLEPARILAKMDAAGVGRVALIPAMNDPVPATPTRLLAVMRKLSGSAAGRAVVEAAHRALLTPEGDLKLSGKVIRIYAHAGFPFYRDLWAYKGAPPNLFVDLSSPYIDEALARAAVAAMGPERCLYGTDAPYGFHEADDTIRLWRDQRLGRADAGDERGA